MKKINYSLACLIIISVTVIFLSRCRKSDSGSTPNVSASFTFMGDGPNVPCTVSFTCTENGATSQSWDFGDDSSSIAINPQHTYLVAGQFTVVLTVNGKGGPIHISKIVNIANKDYDGNIYKTVVINKKTWFAINLMSTHYANGNAIGTTTPASKDISSELTPMYEWPYNGDNSDAAIYGLLYTWYAANDTRNICPTGWHVATDSEWSSLETFLGGTVTAGGKLKEAGFVHWLSPNSGAGASSSGFNALPCGDRQADGSFYDLSYSGYYWTATSNDSTTAWNRYLSYNSSASTRNSQHKSYGLSVRCVWK